MDVPLYRIRTCFSLTSRELGKNKAIRFAQFDSSISEFVPTWGKSCRTPKSQHEKISFFFFFSFQRTKSTAAWRNKWLTVTDKARRWPGGVTYGEYCTGEKLHLVSSGAAMSLENGRQERQQVTKSTIRATLGLATTPQEVISVGLRSRRALARIWARAAYQLDPLLPDQLLMTGRQLRCRSLPRFRNILIVGAQSPGKRPSASPPILSHTHRHTQLQLPSTLLSWTGDSQTFHAGSRTVNRQPSARNLPSHPFSSYLLSFLKKPSAAPMPTSAPFVVHCRPFLL